MIKVGAWQNCKTALLLRWLSTGDDHVRPHTVPDNHRVNRSPLHDAGSTYRDRPTSFVAPRSPPKTSVQHTSAIRRRRRNPHSV